MSKILIGLCLTAQLVLGQILVPLEDKTPVESSVTERLFCKSNNDPHVFNFWDELIEFPYVVTDQCMHQTKFVQVSASFFPCKDNTATCNCGVKVTLLSSGEVAYIDNCANTNPVLPINAVSLSSSPFSVLCQTVSNPLFNPLNEADWVLLPVTTGNFFFLCAIFNGNTYIKTRLSTPNENVIVQVFPDMESLYVHASLSYTASPAYSKKCLCERKTDVFTEQELQLVEELPEPIEKCKGTLLNSCFLNLLNYENFFTPKRIQELEKLIANCAIDIKTGSGQGKIGAFQQNEIQTQIYIALLEALANPANEKYVMEYCACQSKIDPKNVDICKRLNVRF